MNDEFFKQKSLYQEIRDVQVMLQEMSAQYSFDLNEITEITNRNSQEIQILKTKFKNYYLQQFHIHLKIQHISSKIFFGQPEIIRQGSVLLPFKEIINKSIKFEHFCQLSSRVQLSNRYNSLLWTFSVIPSYFNFFMTKEDEKIFLHFLNKIKTSNFQLFHLYSSIIYYHPLFLDFCKITFQPIFSPILHRISEDCHISEKVNSNLSKNIHLCPSIFIKVLQMIPKQNQQNHFRHYCYNQIIYFPQRFFIIPEYYNLSSNKIRFIQESISTFIEMIVSNKQPTRDFYLVDNSPLLFSVSDLESIKFMIKKDLSHNSKFITLERIDTYVEVNKGNDRNIINQDYDFEKQIDSLVNEKKIEYVKFLKHFRELLIQSNLLPDINFDRVNKFELPEILFTFLVSRNEISAIVHRSTFYEIIQPYIDSLSPGELSRYFQFFPQIIPKLSLNQEDEKLKMIIETIFLKTKDNYNLIWKLKDDFFDSKSKKTSKEICSDPFSFLHSFLAIRSPDPLLSKYQYHSMIQNLRFYEFCKLNPDIEKYDKLLYDFVSHNRQGIIEYEQRTQKFYSKISFLLKSSDLESIIKKIQKAFLVNSIPYEKYEILNNCSREVESLIMQNILYEADDILHFSIYLFTLANPMRFISNSVYLYLFYLSPAWNFDLTSNALFQIRLSSFIQLAFSGFSTFSLFFQCKTLKISIIYFHDSDKHGRSLIELIDPDNIHKYKVPFRFIFYSDDLNTSELIFYDFSCFKQDEINQNRSNFDLMIIDSNRIDFIKNVINAFKSVKKKMVLCSPKEEQEMVNSKIQCLIYAKPMTKSKVCNEIISFAKD